MNILESFLSLDSSSKIQNWIAIVRLREMLLQNLLFTKFFIFDERGTDVEVWKFLQSFVSSLIFVSYFNRFNHMTKPFVPRTVFLTTSWKLFRYLVGEGF